MTMKPMQVAALAVALAILTACSTTASPGTGSPSASPTPSAGPVTFYDRVGEVPKSRPDVAAVSVAKQFGKITFAIKFVNAPPLVTDAKSSGFWDLLSIRLVAITTKPDGVHSYRIDGGTPTVRGQPLIKGFEGLPEHVYLTCDDANCQGKADKDIGPIAISGHTLTVSVDSALLGEPTEMTFNVLVTRGTEARLPEYSPGASTDYAPGLSDVPSIWEWKIS
jgi:hypothetical protein